MPTFLNKVVKLSVDRTGYFSMIPAITQLIVKIIAGYISDWLNLSEKLKLQLFNSAAQIGCALCLLPLGFIKSGDGLFAIICFSSSISFLGLVTCGSMKSATLIARSFTHFVMAVVQAIVSISMLFVPYMVGAIAPDNTVEQWRWVFFTVFFILIFTNTIFCIFCSAEPQSWATVQKKQNVLQS
uniref:Major facilitator superfamily (MFS) profile domain-containing protein n=1 Tax=Panagrolaimus sp. JU765 TaxID=591449 RepID=A0AC34RJG9_9BILA